MPRDKTLSHAKIIRAAHEEFIEYGYEKASMRRIGERCGLTAAALYRHFDNKEALFDELVAPAAEDLNAWVEKRLAYTKESAGKMMQESIPDNFGEAWGGIVVDMMKELIYPRMDEFSLLLRKSGGSQRGAFLDNFVSRQQKSISAYLNMKKKKGYEVKEISSEELHILIKAYCTALLEPVVLGCSLEQALKYLENIDAFFQPGWRKLMGSER